MDNSIYIALSKQAAEFRRLDVHAQNMANVNTPSFKQNVTMLTDWTINNKLEGPRQMVSFAQDLRLYRNTQNGALKQTDNPLDLGIEGDAYFSVQTPQGVRYTRAGNFTLNAAGGLVTHDGHSVLDANGAPIVFPPEAENISVSVTGGIQVNGEPFGQLALSSFPSQQKMERLSATLYSTSQAPVPVEANVKVAQGFLEQSNVNPVAELTSLITTERRVGTTSDLMDRAYDMQRRAVTAWAKTDR